MQPGRCETAIQDTDRTPKTVTGSSETSIHIDCTAAHNTAAVTCSSQGSVCVLVSYCGDGGSM